MEGPEGGNKGSFVVLSERAWHVFLPFARDGFQDAVGIARSAAPIPSLASFGWLVY